MPVTRYYMVTGFGTVNPTGSEQSTAFPWGTGSVNNTPRYGTLGLTKPASTQQAGSSGPTSAQTARQSIYAGSLSYELGAQTIAAGSWSFGFQISESNLNANAFIALSVYVWRPSTSSVVGYISDTQAQRGAEPLGTASAYGRVFSVSGSAVTALNGDLLVIELWTTMAQNMATSYTVGRLINSGTIYPDVTNGATTTSTAWIDAPDTLVPVSSGPTTWAGNVSYAGASVFQATAPRLTNAASVSYTGASTYTADDGLLAQTSVSYAATSTYTSDDRLLLNGSVSYAGASTYSAAGNILLQASVPFAGASTYTADDQVIAAGSVSYASASTYTANGTLIGGITQVAVPVVQVRELALPPSVTAGAVSPAVPAVTTRLLALAPSVSQSTIVAVPSARVTLAATAPGRTTTVSRAVPVVSVWFRTVVPTTSAGAVAVAVAPATIRLLSQAPFVTAYIPVQVARVTLNAMAPAISGGGGGGVVVIPRAGGEGRGSVTQQP